MKEKVIAHLLYCPFTGLGRINRGDVWLKNRIKIFKEFVVPSLTNQDNLHYTLWISWRPEDKKNPIVENFYKEMTMLDRMSVVFTYEGLIFYDDKYSDTEAKERLYNNLRRTLPYMKTHTDHADEVRLTIQPSDDMYLADVVEELQTIEAEPFSILGYTKGYITNYHTKEISNYDPETTPPFYTLVMSKEQFQDHQKHYELVKDLRSHEDVIKYNYKELKGRKFVVGCHGQNISTDWSIPYRGRLLSKDEAEKVWIMTGNKFTEPLKIKFNKYLYLRKIYNTLPQFIRTLIKQRVKIYVQQR